MKKLIFLMACLFAMTSVMPVQAKKEKKEKKEFEWKMPELSGNADFDKYLLTCDTLYNRINTYRDSVVFYHVVKYPEVDALGDTIYQLKVQDQYGNYRGTGLAAMQYANLALQGTSLLADLVSITAETASATATLPSLGLKALSYGKYVKAGPKIVSMGTKEIKAIMDSVKIQRKQIRAVRQYYKLIEDKENPNAKADAKKILEVQLENVPEVALTEDEKKKAAEQEAADNALAKNSGYNPDDEVDLD